MAIATIRLAPLARAARRLERFSRLATALFVGLALTQVLALVALAFPAAHEALAIMSLRDGSALDPDLAGKLAVGATVWSLIAMAAILAINSGPRWVIAIAAAVSTLLWLVILAASLGTAAYVGMAFAAAGTAATAGMAPGAAFGIAVGLAAAAWISVEALAASALGGHAALSRRARDVASLRGLRGIGPFDVAGLLAAFDLPVSLRDRGGGAETAVAVLAILAATIGACLWLLIPLNVAVGWLAIANTDCSGSGAPDAALGACFAQNATPAALAFPTFAALAFVVCLVGAIVMAAAQRLMARTLSRRDRAPVVFLRSFKDDQTRLATPLRGPLDFILDLGRSPRNLDQILVYEFARHGPVKALGKPGEKQPPFGAERIYADHATWREDISALIDRARACILVVDDSEGLRWELETSLAREDWRARTLFVLPDPADFDRLRAAADAPEPPPLARGERIIAAAWTPEGWRAYTAASPSRAAFQTLVRDYFSDRAPR